MPPPGGAASNAGENVTRLPRPFSGRGSFSAPARRDGISPRPFRCGTISPLLSEEKCNIMEEEIERARARCRAAEERFLSISDPEMTDYAVYEMEAACRQYAYLVRLRQSKEALSAQKETQGDVHAAETVVK